ncbi:MAG: hypothetical protein AB8B63_19900 [Granulosicoccus sp.]
MMGITGGSLSAQPPPAINDRAFIAFVTVQLCGGVPRCYRPRAGLVWWIASRFRVFQHRCCLSRVCTENQHSWSWSLTIRQGHLSGKNLDVCRVMTQRQLREYVPSMNDQRRVG